MSEDTAGRGRPRPTATIERDDAVLKQLTEAGPQKRDQVAEALGIAGKEVYLSFYRLSRDGKIERKGATWSVIAADGAPVAPGE